MEPNIQPVFDHDDIIVLDSDDIERIKLQMEIMKKSVRKLREHMGKDLHSYGGTYFADGKRKVDFVMVIEKKLLGKPEPRKNLENYLRSVQVLGIELEHDLGKTFPNLLFLKVHCPEDTLMDFAVRQKKPLLFQNPHFGVKKYGQLVEQNTFIKDSKSTRDLERVALARGTQKPQDILNYERSMLVSRMLEKHFAEINEVDRRLNLNALINKRTIQDAYPLHEGPWFWSKGGNMSDRQLLSKVWCSLPFRLNHPVPLVEKYYGPEVGFYAAFSKFYTRMLYIASAAGVACFIMGVIYVTLIDNVFLKELCASELYMCPIACSMKKTCRYVKLKNRCVYAVASLIFDNPMSLVFGLFMSIWATAFVMIWRRKQSEMLIRWGLQYIKNDMSIRHEFVRKAKHFRVWHYNGEIEPYTPGPILAVKYAVVIILLFLMIIVVCLNIVMNILLRIALNRAFRNVQGGALLASVVATSITATIVVILDQIMEIVAFYITVYENPRTQAEFDDSFIGKLYCLKFCNNYLPLFYRAFAQGRMYTYPGRFSKYRLVRRIESAACYVSGCVLKLCVALAIQLIVKSYGELIARFAFTLLRAKFNARKDVMNSPQWEQDYILLGRTRRFILRRYLDLVIEYGYVTFFVASFPLAPLCALIHNLAETKLSAVSIVRYYKKPVPRQVAGIVAWYDILRTVTLFSTLTNAFVLGFTLDGIEKIAYRVKHDGSLKGYLNSTLSEFDTKDYVVTSPFMKGVDTCYYRDYRYSPTSVKKYQHKPDHWKMIALRAVFVIFFENIIFLLMLILMHAIPAIPFHVKREIYYEDHKEFLLEKEKKESIQKIENPYVLPKYEEVADKTEKGDEDKVNDSDADAEKESVDDYKRGKDEEAREPSESELTVIYSNKSLRDDERQDSGKGSKEQDNWA